ncbi:MAG: hypothetical protein ABIE14_03875 [Patescibacteria group bacterium]
MIISLFRKRGMAKQEFLNCRKKIETEIWRGRVVISTRDFNPGGSVVPAAGR